GSLLGIGLTLLCIAAAGPQCGERTEIVKRSGIDLVIALDASTSMLARDVKPSRLDRARLEIGALLDRLKGDRVGLVVFAGEAFVQCPLTVDYSAAKLFLRAVDPQQMPQQGTALAAALRESQRVLEGGGRSGAAKVVLLLTDGEDHEGEAEKAAQELGDAGLKLYSVAIGTETGEPIPLTDKAGNVTGYKKDRNGQTVLTRTDVAGLQQLSEKGGGQLLRAGPGELGVLKMIDEIDRMQHGDLESRLSVQYDDRHQWFAWPAFLLLSVAAMMGEGSLKRRRA
ncbi:MAG: VWA domain-containing protein, partial [Deltaproteobacteria bacterium]|nr:VWA domain-containing protein [Deltaproteobacteria bacterium]